MGRPPRLPIRRVAAASVKPCSKRPKDRRFILLRSSVVSGSTLGNIQLLPGHMRGRGKRRRGFGDLRPLPMARGGFRSGFGSPRRHQRAKGGFGRGPRPSLLNPSRGPERAPRIRVGGHFNGGRPFMSTRDHDIPIRRACSKTSADDVIFIYAAVPAPAPQRRGRGAGTATGPKKLATDPARFASRGGIGRFDFRGPPRAGPRTGRRGIRQPRKSRRSKPAATEEAGRPHGAQ